MKVFLVYKMSGCVPEDLCVQVVGVYTDRMKAERNKAESQIKSQIKDCDYCTDNDYSVDFWIEEIELNQPIPEEEELV